MLTRQRALQAVTAAVAGLPPALLAFRSGGYFPADWGLELGFFALLALVLLIVAERVPVPVGRLEPVMPACLAALALWTLLSLIWSPSAEQPVLAAERALIYVAAVAALLLALARERLQAFLAGLLAATTAIVIAGLESRLLEGEMGTAGDLLSGTRLTYPIGYANALGALAAMGAALALGLALWAPGALLRAGASAALVPLACCLYLTLSRGSFLALAVGMLALVLARRERALAGSLLLLAPAPAAAVLLAARSPLTETGLGASAARGAGHRVALELLVLALLAAWAGLVVPRHGPRLAGLAVAAALLALIAALAAAAWYGPVRLGERVADRFRAAPPATTGDLNRRVLSVGGNGRSDYWRVAGGMVERAPVLGEGGGSYERWWLEKRPLPSYARNAHNLYLETLAELGPLGLVLLVAALAAPLASLPGARGHPLTPAALGAYVAWLVHAALDWDWQIPAVTLTGLAAAVSLLVLARSAGRGWRPRAAGRALVVGPAILLLATALWVHVGNRALGSAQAALAGGRAATAAADARRAHDWMPWAAQPWQLLGEAQAAERRDGAARASFAHALAADPDSWSAWYDLAVVSRGGRHEQALRQARRLNPLAPELTGLR